MFSSPHLVKPLNTSAPPGERKSEGRSVLEKLKSTIHPGRSTQPSAAEVAEREVEGYHSFIIQTVNRASNS